jgi:hypothetical protein
MTVRSSSASANCCRQDRISSCCRRSSASPSAVIFNSGDVRPVVATEYGIPGWPDQRVERRAPLVRNLVAVHRTSGRGNRSQVRRPALPIRASLPGATFASPGASCVSPRTPSSEVHIPVVVALRSFPRQRCALRSHRPTHARRSRRSGEQGLVHQDSDWTPTKMRRAWPAWEPDDRSSTGHRLSNGLLGRCERSVPPPSALVERTRPRQRIGPRSNTGFDPVLVASTRQQASAALQ